MSTRITFDNPGHELDSPANCIRAVKAHHGEGRNAVHTRQCSVCFTTATGWPLGVANAIHYAISPTDADYDGMRVPGTLEYARCKNCRQRHRFLPGTRPEGYPWDETPAQDTGTDEDAA